MKRSSFLKSLLGIAIAPKVVAEVKDKSLFKQDWETKEGLPEVKYSDIVRHPEGFGTVSRANIFGYIYPLIKTYKTGSVNYVTGENEVKTIAITCVDKLYKGVNYCVMVKSEWVGENNKVAEDMIIRDAEMILAMPYVPNPFCDKIII